MQWVLTTDIDLVIADSVSRLNMVAGPWDLKFEAYVPQMHDVRETLLQHLSDRPDLDVILSDRPTTGEVCACAYLGLFSFAFSGIH